MSPRAVYFLDHVALYKSLGHDASAAHRLAQADTAEHFRTLPPFGVRRPFVHPGCINDTQWDYDEERRSGWTV